MNKTKLAQGYHLRYDKVSSRHDSPGVMGGVCKVWYVIHRNVMIYDY